MEKLLPYIQAALLCEKVLQETNGSLSIIHIADKLEYRAEGYPPGYKPAIILTGLLALKSGPVVGNHAVKVVVENPVGERREISSTSFEFLGKDHGQNIILNLTLGIAQDGIYWFDVFFDEDLLTRIPLIVAQGQEQKPQEPKAWMTIQPEAEARPQSLRFLYLHGALAKVHRTTFSYLDVYLNIRTKILRWQRLGLRQQCFHSGEYSKYFGRTSPQMNPSQYCGSETARVGSEFESY
jgi:hypothetical protein